jgi:hypothetical protein
MNWRRRGRRFLRRCPDSWKIDSLPLGQTLGSEFFRGYKINNFSLGQIFGCNFTRGWCAGAGTGTRNGWSQLTGRMVAQGWSPVDQDNDHPLTTIRRWSMVDQQS